MSRARNPEGRSLDITRGIPAAIAETRNLITECAIHLSEPGFCPVRYDETSPI
jgi:hypothetical protein